MAKGISREQQLANLRAAQAEQMVPVTGAGNFVGQQMGSNPLTPPPQTQDQSASQFLQSDATRKAFQSAFGAAGQSPFARGTTLEFLRSGGKGTPTDYISGPDSPYAMPESWQGEYDPEKPIAITGAVNAAQRAGADAKDQQNVYQQALAAAQQSVGGAKERVKGLDSSGFQRESGRRYSSELDAAGNVIAINALRQPKGEGTLTEKELQDKSWRAAGSQGGAGNPFTPNLDKFKSVQDPESMAMAAKNAEIYRQSKMAEGRGAAEEVKARQAERNEKLVKMGIDPKTMESNPNAGPTVQTATYDPSKDAAAALQAGRDKAAEYYKKGEGLYKEAAGVKKEAEAMPYIKGTPTEGAGGGMMSPIAKGEAPTKAKGLEQSAQSAMKQGVMESDAGVIKSSALSSIPKTNISKIEVPKGKVNPDGSVQSGTVYSSAIGKLDSRAIAKAEEQKSFKEKKKETPKV